MPRPDLPFRSCPPLSWSGRDRPPSEGASPQRIIDGASQSLIDRFLGSARRFPERVALVVAGTTRSYAGLRQHSARIARSVLDGGCEQGDLVGVFAHRSLTAYTGILGALMAGCGYVPLHPCFPAERTRRMFRLAGLSTVVVGAEALIGLDTLLEGATSPLTIIGPEIGDFGALPLKRPSHRFITAAQTAGLAPLRQPRPAAPEDVAYLLFTSGSTGIPKGVPVSQRNVAGYLDHMADRLDIGPEDRVSQTFDLTFDLGVHDLFATWQAGAALCVLPERTVMAPAKFIVEQGLTVWFSVPSVAMIMARLRLLKPGVFPLLRLVLFCGEALPVGSVLRWTEAAPNARFENLYGPTETTIAITGFRWAGKASVARCRGGIVPIGVPFPGQEIRILDSQGEPILGPGRGELLLAGSQVTAGYWRAPDKTAERYLRFPDCPESLWYRTGDIVERDVESCLHFIGRVDNQIKLNGHRIELQDVDAALREATGSDLAVSVAWPAGEAGVLGIVGCVEASIAADDTAVLRRCAELLPPYMVPSRIHRVRQMPLNVNGKIDRGALRDELERLAGGTGAANRLPESELER